MASTRGTPCTATWRRTCRSTERCAARRAALGHASAGAYVWTTALVCGRVCVDDSACVWAR
eukprot:305808-Chlamydomonas_euryale.AAC.1